MATANRNREIRMDENQQYAKAIESKTIGLKPVGLKKEAISTTAASRPALSNLVNRQVKNNDIANPKKVSATTGMAVVSGVDLKKVKPRVKSHWDGEMPGARKVITRSSTTRPVTSTTSSSLGVLNQPLRTKVPLTSDAEPKLLKARTITTAKVAVPTLRTTTAVSDPVIKQDNNVVTISVKQDPIEYEYVSHSANLLQNYTDIDVNDDANILLVSEYVNDIYEYLRKLEVQYEIRENHLKGQTEVLPKMRAVLIDWINDVHLQYRFMQETFHMAVSIIDRYLQASTRTTRKNLQLVGITALFIASKYEELYPPEVKDFVYITDDTYNRNQVLDMEKHILKKLGFELGAPLSIHFLRRYSKAAQSNTDTHIMAKYFLELSTVEYKMCAYHPSEIAAAAIFISLRLQPILKVDQLPKSTGRFDYESIWNSTLEHYTTYSLEDMKPCIKKMAETIVMAPYKKSENVYRKYQSGQFNKVSEGAKRCESAIRDICNDL